MPGWGETNPFAIRLDDGWSEENGSLWLGDKQIARIQWDADGSLWSATFFLDATNDDVRELVHRLQWQPSESAPGEIRTTLLFHNGSGRLMSSQPVRFINTAVNGFGNPRLTGDVNDDEAVSALDALLIINLLNRAKSLAVDLTTLQPTDGPIYPDVTGDENASALDALTVINILNRQSAPEREAESASPLPHRRSGDETADGSASTTAAWTAVPFPFQPGEHPSADAAALHSAASITPDTASVRTSSPASRDKALQSLYRGEHGVDPTVNTPQPLPSAELDVIRVELQSEQLDGVWEALGQGD